MLEDLVGQMKDCNEKSACMNRREFLVKTGVLAGGVVLTVSSLGGAALGRSFEDVNVPISPDGPLAKVGGSQVIDTSVGKVIVIQVDKGKYVAFSAKCTHKGSIVGYNAGTKQIECPKHGSRFDTADGKVLGGPADAALPKYNSKSDDKSVTVTIAS